MMERHPLIQQAFEGESLADADRDRLWTTLQGQQSRQARLRYLAWAGILLIIGAIAAGVLFGRSAIRALSSTSRGAFSPVVAAADSLSSDVYVENSMTQETRAEVPSNLIPLLGHRSGLAIDLKNFNSRRDALEQRLNQTAGSEHERIAAELESVERQIHSTQVAIDVIDRQLAGHTEPVAVAAPGEPPSITIEPPQIITMTGPFSREMGLIGGAGLLLALGMVAVLYYIRRLSRMTKEALSLIEGQVASQHATLASGIDAIALEVERLGEGQRFMSKALSEKVAVKP